MPLVRNARTGLVFLGLLHQVVASPKEWPTRSFKSSPATPPFMNITQNGPTAEGLIFLSPSLVLPLGTGSGRPMIFDNDGNLIWQGPMDNSTYFQPQELHGQPVLTYWSGMESSMGIGVGAIHILDQSYEEIHRVTLAGNETWLTPFPKQYPTHVDKHEHQITEWGSMLVTAINESYVKHPQQLGGPPQPLWLQDSLFYEIDIPSNEVLFR